MVVNCVVPTRHSRARGAIEFTATRFTTRNEYEFGLVMFKALVRSHQTTSRVPSAPCLPHGTTNRPYSFLEGGQARLSTHYPHIFTRERSGTVPVLNIIHTLSTDIIHDYPQVIHTCPIMIDRPRARTARRPHAPKRSRMCPIHGCCPAGKANPMAATPGGKG